MSNDTKKTFGRRDPYARHDGLIALAACNIGSSMTGWSDEHCLEVAERIFALADERAGLGKHEEDEP